MDDSKRRWLHRPELGEAPEPGGNAGLLRDPNAMMAIFFTVMNFLWIFPTLGGIAIFLQNPVQPIEGQTRVTMESFHIEHWIAVVLIFLQLIFLNGWLFTNRFLPRSVPSAPKH